MMCVCGEDGGEVEAAYGQLLVRVFKAYNGLPDHNMEDVDV